MTRKPPTKPMIGEVIIGMTTLWRTPSMTSLPSFTFFTRPDDRVPVVMGAGNGRTAEAADEGVGGAGGQAEPPGEQVPYDPAQQRADDDHGGDELARPPARTTPFSPRHDRQAPTRFVHAAIRIAWRGVITLVETTVAIEFAVS